MARGAARWTVLAERLAPPRLRARPVSDTPGRRLARRLLQRGSALGDEPGRTNRGRDGSVATRPTRPDRGPPARRSRPLALLLVPPETERPRTDRAGVPRAGVRAIVRRSHFVARADLGELARLSIVAGRGWHRGVRSVAGRAA